MKNKLSDNWRTPQWLFDELNEEFNFDIDLCAIRENSKCSNFCKNYLDYDLSSLVRVDGKYTTAFMNPPYSNPLPFVEKAWEDSKHCKIVLLLKVDTSTKWWSVFWDYGTECENCLAKGWIYNQGLRTTLDCGYCSGNFRLNGPKPGCEVRFLPKRVQFDPPIELIESGEVWKEKINIKYCERCHGSDAQLIYEQYYCEDCNNRGYTFKEKWVQKCDCNIEFYGTDIEGHLELCKKCKGEGYKKLSGPSFPVCVVIFDRREL